MRTLQTEFPSYQHFADRRINAADHFQPVRYERVKLRTGYVCKQCQQSVLAYSQPKKCTEHED